MDVPVGPLSIPAQLVAPSRLPPVIRRGTATDYDGRTFTVELEGEGKALEAGDRVVLDLEAPDTPLIEGNVASVDGQTIGLRVERSRPREPREFPRVAGTLSVRYRLASDAGDESAWRTPARVLDWSAGGFGFVDGPRVKAGDHLLLELSLAEGQAPWQAEGRVIRVHEVGAGEHQVAVNFEEIPAEAREALLEGTIDSQRLPGEA